MAKVFNRIYRQITAASGGIGFSTGYTRGLIKQIIVKPATSSTIYDFAISDGSSLNIFEREAVADELNETIEIPVNSSLLVAVSNASVNELFKVLIVIEETS